MERSWTDKQLDNPKVARAAFEETKRRPSARARSTDGIQAALSAVESLL